MRRTKMLVLIITLLALGCKKGDEQVYTGGKGGSGRILVTPGYNGQFVGNLPIYLDWRDPATKGDPPPPGADDTAYCVQLSGKPVAIFDNLKPGRYFISAGGRDTAQNLIIFRGNKTVYLQEAESLEITLDMATQ